MREATTGATTASASFSSAIGTPNPPIRVRAPASPIVRCDRAGGKTWHAARKPHGRSGLDSALRWLLLVRSAFGFLEIFWGTKSRLCGPRSLIRSPGCWRFCWPPSVGREPKNPPFGHHSYRAYQRQLNRRRRQSLAALQLSVKKLDCGNALFAGDGDCYPPPQFKLRLVS